MSVVSDRRDTIGVDVDGVRIGGGAPVVIQSMTNTDTADVAATVSQVAALAGAGSELVRITVNSAAAAQAVPEIRRRLDDLGCSVPLIGDFHFNGHTLLGGHPDCARALAKFRINPGNVGRGQRRDDNFATICGLARDHGKAVRIGVNGGSLDAELVTRQMEANFAGDRGLSAEHVLDECMVLSALQSTELARATGLGADRIVLSCKVSEPARLIRIYRELARRTRQPLHLGLTEAGMGVKGTVWSAAAMGTLLADGIGDTVRVSLTPRPGGDRTAEVEAARQLVQALGIRTFAPSVTACPGCGRTTSSTFQELAERVEGFVRDRMPAWSERHPGVEEMRLAVMGCVVNGPGESKSANIGISLPGTGEAPRCPVYVDGVQVTTFQGDAEQLAADLFALIESYVERTYPIRGPDRP